MTVKYINLFILNLYYDLNSKGKANKFSFSFKIFFGICAYLILLINFTIFFYS